MYTVRDFRKREIIYKKPIKIIKNIKNVKKNLDANYKLLEKWRKKNLNYKLKISKLLDLIDPIGSEWETKMWDNKEKHIEFVGFILGVL